MNDIGYNTNSLVRNLHYLLMRPPVGFWSLPAFPNINIESLSNFDWILLSKLGRRSEFVGLLYHTRSAASRTDADRMGFSANFNAEPAPVCPHLNCRFPRREIKRRGSAGSPSDDWKMAPRRVRSCQQNKSSARCGVTFVNKTRFLKIKMLPSSKKLSLFEQQKQSTLNRKDLSLKGSIDEPIRALVDIINTSPYYYTTSTCSGRVTLIEKPYGKPNSKNKNKFILSCHLLDELKNLNATIRDKLDEEKNSSNDEDDDTCLWLKVEPFILHVQCLNLDKAQNLLTNVLATGCRNSGLTLGKPDKFMVAVRSASSMEVPLKCGNKFELTNSYLAFLSQESERRLSDNLERLIKLESSLSEVLALDWTWLWATVTTLLEMNFQWNPQISM